MKRVPKKLIQEIILEDIEVMGPIADVARGSRLAAKLAKALGNPSKYRREQRAEMAELMSVIAENMDGDEIIGHRD
jgi:hypothetical protein